MRVELARSALRSCPALVLLLLGLSCSRPSGPDACAEGQACEGEPSAPNDTPAGVAPAGRCGDGIVDAEREECDDGSACRDGRDCTEEPARCQVGSGDRSCAPRTGDGCSVVCRVEPGYRCSAPGPCQRLAAAPAGGDAAPGMELDPAPSSTGGGDLLGGAGSSAVGGPTPPGAACEVDRFEAPERVLGLELAPVGIGVGIGIGAGAGGVQLWAPALSGDASTLFFAAALPGVPERIFFASRLQRGRRFGDVTALPGVESGVGDGTPLLSRDGLRLYFYSRRDGGSGDRDLWQATRAEPSADFEPAKPLAGVNSPELEHLPWLSPDELTLLFVSTRPGGLGQSDLWLARRTTLAGEFSAPELLSAVASSADEGRGVLASSGRALIFASDRAGGQGMHDLWLATRADESEDFGEVRVLSELNGPGMDLDPFLTLDERELFFVSNRGGRPEIWRAQRDCND